MDGRAVPNDQAAAEQALVDVNPFEELSIRADPTFVTTQMIRTMEQAVKSGKVTETREQLMTADVLVRGNSKYNLTPHLKHLKHAYRIDEEMAQKLKNANQFASREEVEAFGGPELFFNNNSELISAWKKNVLGETEDAGVRVEEITEGEAVGGGGGGGDGDGDGEGDAEEGEEEGEEEEEEEGEEDGGEGSEPPLTGAPTLPPLQPKVAAAPWTVDGSVKKPKDAAGGGFGFGMQRGESLLQNNQAFQFSQSAVGPAVGGGHAVGAVAGKDLMTLAAHGVQLAMPTPPPGLNAALVSALEIDPVIAESMRKSAAAEEAKRHAAAMQELEEFIDDKKLTREKKNLPLYQSMTSEEVRAHLQRLIIGSEAAEAAADTLKNARYGSAILESAVNAMLPGTLPAGFLLKKVSKYGKQARRPLEQIYRENMNQSGQRTPDQQLYRLGVRFASDVVITLGKHKLANMKPKNKMTGAYNDNPFGHTNAKELAKVAAEDYETNNINNIGGDPDDPDNPATASAAEIMRSVNRKVNDLRSASQASRMQEDLLQQQREAMVELETKLKAELAAKDREIALLRTQALASEAAEAAKSTALLQMQQRLRDRQVAAPPAAAPAAAPAPPRKQPAAAPAAPAPVVKPVAVNPFGAAKASDVVSDAPAVEVRAKPVPPQPPVRPPTPPKPQAPAAVAAVQPAEEEASEPDNEQYDTANSGGEEAEDGDDGEEVEGEETDDEQEEDEEAEEGEQGDEEEEEEEEEEPEPSPRTPAMITRTASYLDTDNEDSDSETAPTVTPGLLTRRAGTTPSIGRPPLPSARPSGSDISNESDISAVGSGAVSAVQLSDPRRYINQMRGRT